MYYYIIKDNILFACLNSNHIFVPIGNPRLQKKKVPLCLKDVFCFLYVIRVVYFKETTYIKAVTIILSSIFSVTTCRRAIFSFICMFCRSLFVFLYFFFCPLCCLFFFDLRILITRLVYSNSSSIIIMLSFIFSVTTYRKAITIILSFIFPVTTYRKAINIIVSFIFPVTTYRKGITIILSFIFPVKTYKKAITIILSFYISVTIHRKAITIILYFIFSVTTYKKLSL